MPSDLRAAVVADLDGIRALEPAWRALSREARDPSTFLGYDWGISSAEAFAASRTLAVVVVRRGEEVAGILPLSIEKGAVNFLGSPEADANDLVCRAGTEAEVAPTAMDALLGLRWTRCALDNIWEDSALVQAF